MTKRFGGASVALLLPCSPSLLARPDDREPKTGTRVRGLPVPTPIRSLYLSNPRAPLTVAKKACLIGSDHAAAKPGVGRTTSPVNRSQSCFKRPAPPFGCTPIADKTKARVSLIQNFLISPIAAQPRTLRLSVPLSIPREENMLTLIGSQIVPTAAYESACAEACLRSRLCPKQVDSSPLSETGRISRRIQDADQHRYPMGTTEPVGFLQSLFNPHISTALVA
jgi:hypothetical protein